MEPVLAICDLTKEFGILGAVSDISFNIQPKEIVGLVGPDGAGKTTLLRMIAALITPTRGTIRVLGQDFSKPTSALRSHVGYMPQQYSLYLDLSVQENLRFFAGMYGVSRRDILAREKRLLSIANLEEFRNRAAGALSGGMYKKLALSCALIHAPQLLLLDEPTNGVDPISRRELWTFLRELITEGVGILVSTPYMDEAERCDRVGLMVGGRLVALDSPDKLKSEFSAHVLELTVDPLFSDLSPFAKIKNIEQVYSVGRKLRVITKDADALTPDLSEAITNAGTHLVELHEVKPSFEDVFLDLSHRAEKETQI